MKITASKVDRFLKQPDPDLVAVLVYGPDNGLVRERSGILARGVVEDITDPFRVVELTGANLKSDGARLSDEAAALSFTGGRRLVRVGSATDELTEVFRELLNNPSGDSLVLIEAGDLSNRSKLRNLFERADNAAAVPCYPDNLNSLHDVISGTLRKHGLTATPEAISYLVTILGADRLVTRNELEKLALYKGEPGTVTLEDVLDCVGDSAAVSMDAVTFAACGGDRAALDRALMRAYSEGNNPVGVLRAAARHIQRLHQAEGLIARGHSSDQAMKSLRPPVIFTQTDRFQTQLRMWSVNRLAEALDLLTQAEIDCKTTGLPAETICGRALMRIAQAARHSATRRG